MKYRVDGSVGISGVELSCFTVEGYVRGGGHAVFSEDKYQQ